MARPRRSPGDDAGWIGETALDVDMVSAACPKCKIVVVQAGAAGNAGLEIGQLAATKLGVGTISDSWGGPEDGDETTQEADFHNPGIGTFVSSGDYGYDSEEDGGGVGSGAQYPSTSQFVVAVGGVYVAANGSGSGPGSFTQIAWDHAGSSCSTSIAKPSYQPVSANCSKRATSDVSAVADGQQGGVASYIAAQGGWTPAAGTSAASPLTAAMFAAAGHGDATPAFVYKHPEIFTDITTGANNGNCGSTLCIPQGGWDGPTGLGVPDQSKIVGIGNQAGAGPSVAITFPDDGATVDVDFTIAATPGSGANYVEFQVDGTRVGALDTAPYQLSAPDSVTDGAHAVTAIAYDIDHNSQSTTIHVTVGSGSGSDDGGGGGGGCAAGGSGGGAGGGSLGLALVGLGLLVSRRRT